MCCICMCDMFFFLLGFILYADGMWSGVLYGGLNGLVVFLSCNVRGY